MAALHSQDGEHVALIIDFDTATATFEARVITPDAENHGGTPEWVETSADYTALLADATAAFENFEGIFASFNFEESS